MKQYYIYLTTNLITGRKYIGKHHGEIDDNYLGSGRDLVKDIRTLGKNNFKKEILFISHTEEENANKEKEFIKAFDAVQNPLFYNIHEGGNGGNTRSGWSKKEKEEYAKTMSEKYKGKNNPRYGVHLTDETKQKIRENRDTSYMRTEEYRINMSKAVSGEKNGMYGKHHTEESKKLMSEHSKGKTAGNKNGMYGKSKDQALNGKKVYMYDKDHNLVRVFNAKTAVLAFLNMKGHTGLDKAIKEKSLYKGFYWSVETNIEE